MRIRRKGMRSWFDKQWGPIFKAALRRRLDERCKGERGVFLTLTYDRSPYDCPADLYDRAQVGQHVALFMRRLSRALGRSLKGEWLCKLEFQSGGWVHWHIILMGESFVSYEAIRDAWGHGHVDVRRLTNKSRRYICKYVSKDGTLPAFLMHRPAGSVRVVRVSPGFWRGRGKPGERWVLDRCESIRGMFQSLGQALQRGDEEALVGVGGKYRSVRARVESVMLSLLDLEGVVIRSGGRWVELEFTSGWSAKPTGRWCCSLDSYQHDPDWWGGRWLPKWVRVAWLDAERGLPL